MANTTYRLPESVLPNSAHVGHVSLFFSWGATCKAFALRHGQTVVVGRAEPASLILDERSLSRTHARFALCDGCVTVEDLGSTNGVWLNGVRVADAVLTEGDVALLGSVEVRVSGTAGALPRTHAVLSHAAFMAELHHELTRARFFGRCAVVVALRHAEQPDFASAAARAVRTVDWLCFFGPALTMVLLSESDANAAASWVESLRVRTKARFAVGLASYPMLSCTAEELVSRVLDAAHAARPGEVQRARSSEPVANLNAPVIISPRMRQLYELSYRAARTTLPVLVLGETGSGKELVARAVHERSPRAKGPFKAINCATIPANLLESVLFGHERGAFTGADRQALGIFEQAQGGTVFLDEVGELSAQAQAALLRVLELRSVVRVGGTREVELDVRVIAATHRELATMVAAGRFREDLIFRLDALSLRVPPLRERREEIIPLAQLFLERARGQWGASAERLSPEVVEALEDYTWPGNVRQLKNAIERAVAVCVGPEVQLEDLPEQLRLETDESVSTVRVRPAVDGFRSLPDRVREFESELIRDALERAGGNQAQAARILGLPRRTLANKVHAYGLLQISQIAGAP